jgi:hypothetical protein
LRCKAGKEKERPTGILCKVNYEEAFLSQAIFVEHQPDLGIEVVFDFLSNGQLQILWQFSLQDSFVLQQSQYADIFFDGSNYLQ